MSRLIRLGHRSLGWATLAAALVLPAGGCYKVRHLGDGVGKSFMAITDAQQKRGDRDSAVKPMEAELAPGAVNALIGDKKAASKPGFSLVKLGERN